MRLLPPLTRPREFTLNRDSMQARGLVCWIPDMEGVVNFSRDRSPIGRTHVTWTAQPPLVGEPTLGLARSFDGSTQYGIGAVNNDVTFGTGDFTISFWFNSSSVMTSFYIPIGKDDGSQRDWAIIIGLTSARISWFNYVTLTEIAGTTALSANTWYHAAFVRKAGTLTIYINGIAGGSGAESSDHNKTNMVWIGRREESSVPAKYPGMLTDIRFSKYAHPPEIIWQQWAPQTRGELYQPVKRRARVFVSAATFTLSADAGSHLVTGTAATLKADRKLTADSDSYVVTGTAAILSKGFPLSAESGSFVITGTDVTFRLGYGLTAEAGSLSFTGTAASLLKDTIFSAAGAAYVITGTDATLSVITFGVILTVDNAAGTITVEITNIDTGVTTDLYRYYVDEGPSTAIRIKKALPEDQTFEDANVQSHREVAYYIVQSDGDVSSVETITQELLQLFIHQVTRHDNATNAAIGPVSFISPRPQIDGHARETGAFRLAEDSQVTHIPSEIDRRIFRQLVHILANERSKIWDLQDIVDAKGTVCVRTPGLGGEPGIIIFGTMRRWSPSEGTFLSDYQIEVEETSFKEVVS